MCSRLFAVCLRLPATRSTVCKHQLFANVCLRRLFARRSGRCARGPLPYTYLPAPEGWREHGREQGREGVASATASRQAAKMTTRRQDFVRWRRGPPVRAAFLLGPNPMDLVTRKRFFGDSPVCRALRLWAQHAEVLWIVEARPPRRLLPRGLELFGGGLWRLFGSGPFGGLLLLFRACGGLGRPWRSAVPPAARMHTRYGPMRHQPWYAMVRKHFGVCLRLRLFVWLFVWVRGGLGVLFAIMACL